MRSRTRHDHGPATRSPGPWIFWAALGLVGCSQPAATPAPTIEAAKPGAAKPGAAKPEVPSPPTGDAVRFEDELAAVDQRIAAHRARADASKGWLVLGSLAEDYLDRARLSGDYDDYAAAEEVLASAFARAPEGAGPFMSRAQLHFTLHRLDAATADLERAAARLMLSDREQAQLAGLRADVAFQRGDAAAALAGFEAALAAGRTPTALARMALYRWKTGDFEAADALYAEALERYDGEDHQPRAWFNLLRGLLDLDRGRDREALAHYRAAEAELAGYWLVEEHIAEIQGRLGEREAAIALYESLVERTQNPEFMDALAELLAEGGDKARAEQLHQRARAAYEGLLVRFPEAAAGHAIDHFLERGDQPARALELAQKNHAIRPNPDAKVLLARAYLAAGDAAQAEATIREALAGPWDFVDLHDAAAEVFAARGLADAAADERAKARALCPSCGDGA